MQLNNIGSIEVKCNLLRAIRNLQLKGQDLERSYILVLDSQRRSREANLPFRAFLWTEKYSNLPQIKRSLRQCPPSWWRYNQLAMSFSPLQKGFEREHLFPHPILILATSSCNLHIIFLVGFCETLSLWSPQVVSRLSGQTNILSLTRTANIQKPFLFPFLLRSSVKDKLNKPLARRRRTDKAA